MGLQITHQLRAGIDVVTVVGEVDIYTVARLREALLKLLGAEPRDVVIDITGVPFLDWVGLGVLVGALRRARLTGGVVRLAGPDARAATVLRITGMVKVFRIYPDVTSALAHPHDLPHPSGPAEVPRLAWTPAGEAGGSRGRGDRRSWSPRPAGPLPPGPRPTWWSSG